VLARPFSSFSGGPFDAAHKVEPMEKTRRYSITVRDVATGQDVLFTAVDWDDDNKRVALGQIMRLIGAPEVCGFLDEVASKPKRRGPKPA
jgi:hypothetical protein